MEDGDPLKEKLGEVKERYENLTEETKERVGKVTKAVELSRKFVEDSDYLRNLLNESEYDLAKLDNKSCEEEDIIEDITHAKVCKDSLKCY